MNSFLRTLLFASSLAPAILIGAAAQIWNVGTNFEVYCWIAASALTCLLPLLVAVEASKRTAQTPFVAKKIESQDWLLVVFVVSYFVPLVTKISNLQTLGLIFLVAAVLAATLEAIPVHPVLHLFRYRFYKVEGDNGVVYVMITKRKLLSAKDIKTVQQLSPQLLMSI
ncbi:MAG: hypothetical protein ACEQSE_12215 [Candidatus Aquirickettsiella gammari]|uniref:hypothetical protein n=1 Tax=Undibacterium sp. Ji22W TaxID=3413038 RepID=UPI0028EC1FB4|nr:hypothetical protein [uncultured Undibacterium sp.]